jgi:hypothetical protein
VAADGSGKNGLYTGELLKALQEPGLKVEDVFKRVRVSVMELSHGAQTPWESSSRDYPIDCVSGVCGFLPSARFVNARRIDFRFGSTSTVGRRLNVRLPPKPDIAVGYQMLDGDHYQAVRARYGCACPPPGQGAFSVTGSLGRSSSAASWRRCRMRSGRRSIARSRKWGR